MQLTESAPLIVATLFALVALLLGTRAGEWRTALLRALTLLLLGVAAARPYRIEVQELAESIVLLDISESMDEGIAESLLRNVRALESDSFRVLLFPFAGGIAPYPVSSADSFLDIKRRWQSLNSGASNLEAALHAVSAGVNSPIALISDGHETTGDVTAALQQHATRVYPFLPRQEEWHADQFTIAQLHAPLVAPAQKSVEIRATVRNSTAETLRGTLRILHGEKELQRREVEVPANSDLVEIVASDPAQEGIKPITATLTPAQSRFPEHSRTVFLSGEERERVLLVHGSSEDARYLTETLEGQAYQVTSLTAQSTKLQLPDLSKFSAVIFNNIARTQLEGDAVRRVQRYVQQGGGFAMIGGQRSFGLGGYLRTEFDELLPVEMVPPQTVKKRLNVAVQLVIDKSNSMKFDNRIDFAKEAARQVVANLKDDDYVGFVAFDKVPFIALPIEQLATARAKAMDRVRTIFPASTTNMLPALEEARRGLMRVDAGRKHMIVLTDGKIPDASPYYLEQVRSMRLAGITVSTVMVGTDADDVIFRQMAEVGGGAFYHTADPRMLPRIFVSDVKVSTGERTMKEEQEYRVRAGTGSLHSTTIQSFPPLRGYVQTKPKQRANLELVVMAADRAEPLLATWKYGEGRATAFTADASGRWSSSWIRWPRFSTFWSELIDSLREDAQQQGSVRFDLRYAVERGSLHLDLSVYSSEAANRASGEVRMPDGGVRAVNFERIAPGRFRAQVPEVSAGTYQLELRVGERRLTPVAFQLPGTLFGEQIGQGFNRPLLERLALESGGTVNAPLEALRAERTVRSERRPLTTWFVLAALLCMLLEILTREVWRGRARPLRAR